MNDSIILQPKQRFLRLLLVCSLFVCWQDIISGQIGGNPRYGMVLTIVIEVSRSRCLCLRSEFTCLPHLIHLLLFSLCCTKVSAQLYNRLANLGISPSFCCQTVNGENQLNMTVEVELNADRHQVLLQLPRYVCDETKEVDFNYTDIKNLDL